jgi:acyl-CoA synthetase (AMP-forming)/AMP-acid ligase II
VFLEAFKPDTVVDTWEALDVTMAGSATAFHQVYAAVQRASDRQRMPKVRCFPGGGSPKPPALHHELKQLYPNSVGIVAGYGLTECPIITMAKPTDLDEDLANTEGSPMPGVDIRIVKTDGTIAAPGEEGEVRAKAPQLMLGYLDSSLDADAFDEDGYFRTGDLGSLNERNMLSITGRLKDIIIRKGENISAKEVEDNLYTHPKVADVAVVGLPDASSGERVCAVVATAEGQEPLTYDEMKAHLLDAGLMIIKVPEQLEHVDAIPRNPAGKVLKADLKKQYEGSSPTRA